MGRTDATGLDDPVTAFCAPRRVTQTRNELVISIPLTSPNCPAVDPTKMTAAFSFASSPAALSPRRYSLATRNTASRLTVSVRRQRSSPISTTGTPGSGEIPWLTTTT